MIVTTGQIVTGVITAVIAAILVSLLAWAGNWATGGGLVNFIGGATQEQINNLKTQKLDKCQICLKPIGNCREKDQNCSTWVTSDNKIAWTDPFIEDTHGKIAGCKYELGLQCSAEVDNTE